jgi:hypothetical protein
MGDEPAEGRLKPLQLRTMQNVMELIGRIEFLNIWDER